MDFLVQIRDPRPKTDRCTKCQPNWTKTEEAQISTSKDSENCLMTTYIRDNDDVIKLFNAFERFCPGVPSCQVRL